MSELSETPFRVYRLEDGRPTCIGAADEFSLGELLLDLRATGKLTGPTAVGILHRPVEDEPGEWIVNPWNTSRDGTRLLMESERR